MFFGARQFITASLITKKTLADKTKKELIKILIIFKNLVSCLLYNYYKRKDYLSTINFFTDKNKYTIYVSKI